MLLQASDPYVRIRGATRAGARAARTRARSTRSPPRARGLALTKGNKVIARFSEPFKVYRPDEPIRLMGPAINGVNDGLYRGKMEIRAGAERRRDRDQRDQGRPLHPGGRARRDALLLAHGGAQGAGGGRPHLRACHLARPAACSTSIPDTRSQVYEGVSGETARTNPAVAATDNEVVEYDGGIDHHLLLLHLRRAHRERGEQLPRRRPAAVAARASRTPTTASRPATAGGSTSRTARLDAALGAPGRLRKVRVIKRGVSPRDRARPRVRLAAARPPSPGPTIRARLGLYDTWAYFTKVSSSSASRGDRRHSAPARGRTCWRGVFQPAPRRRRLTVERRAGSRWERVERRHHHAAEAATARTSGATASTACAAAWSRVPACAWARA